MELSTSLLQLPAAESARVLALSYLEKLAAQRQRLDDTDDAEALHDFRVALRRLRSCLRAYRAHLGDAVSSRTRRRLRELGRGSGTSRDLEVQVAWLAGPGRGRAADVQGFRRRLARSLARDLERARRPLRRMIRGKFQKFEQQLTAELARYQLPAHPDSVPAEALAGAATADLLRDLAAGLREHLGRVHGMQDIAEAHLARIAAKRVRYLLEPLQHLLPEGTRPVSRLRELQDDFGELNDARLFLEWAAERLGRAPARADAGGRGRRRRSGLRALRRALLARQQRAMLRLQANWLDGHADELLAALAKSATDLAGLGAPRFEVERKYLLRGLPPRARQGELLEIEQGWLPGLKVVERLRRVRSEGAERYYRTIKLGAGVRRLELEEQTSREVFDRLWPLTRGRRLAKRRWQVREGGRLWQFDEFEGRNLVLAEVELISPEEPVLLPPWIGDWLEREVTGEPEYLNYNLAT